MFVTRLRSRTGDESLPFASLPIRKEIRQLLCPFEAKWLRTVEYLPRSTVLFFALQLEGGRWRPSGPPRW